MEDTSRNSGTTSRLTDTIHFIRSIMDTTMERVLHGLARRMDQSPGFHYHARTYHRCEGWLQVEVVGQLLGEGILGINVEDHERSLLGRERYVDLTFPNTVLEIACHVDEVPNASWFKGLEDRLSAFDKYLYQYALICVMGARPALADRAGYGVVRCIEGNSYTLLLYRRNR